MQDLNRQDLIREITRRTFLGTTGVAAAGLGLAGCAARTATTPHTEYTQTGKSQTKKDTSRVAVIDTRDRRQGTYDSLKPFASEVAQSIGNKQVIIKVNAGFPSEAHKIHSTHPDQIRGILDFLREFYDGSVWIAEGVGSSPTGDMMDAYKLFGHDAMVNEYSNVTLVDANLTNLSTKYIHQYREEPVPINIISMYFEPDKYIISAAKMKTHNAVAGTFSLKNISQGSPVGQRPGGRNEKNKMHGGYGAGISTAGKGGQELSYNIFRLALDGVYPDLGVVDGIYGIEGDGPWDGPEIEHNVAVASTDFVACDRACTELIGLDPFYMKYLEWCGMAGLGNWDRENIETIGSTIEQKKVQYEMHPRLMDQVTWIDELFSRDGAANTGGFGGRQRPAQ